jgi:ATP cone domain
MRGGYRSVIRSAKLVRKRDGREVPFEQSKIVDAIWRAARAVGGGDRLLAEELGSVVAMFIDRDFAERTPSIDDVSDLIERVLAETGHARTAKAYILERERRDRIRNALRVRDDEPAKSAGEIAVPPAVDAHARATVSAWSKAKIVEALVVEAEIPEGVAAEIASEVERRVFASGMTRVSTSLIRALVDNELFERGHDRWLRRQAMLGIPRYDLDHWARGGVEREGEAPAFGAMLDRATAHATWSQYSLVEIHEQEVAEAHAAGRIHIGGLATPTRLQGATLDLTRLDLSQIVPVKDLALEYGDALRLIAARGGDVAGESVTLKGVEDFVVGALATGAAPQALARRLLLALAAPASADGPGCRVELELPLEPARNGGLPPSAYANFVHELVAEVRRLDLRVHAPRLAFDLAGARSAAPDVLAAIALAEAHGDGVVIRAGLAARSAPAVTPRIQRVDVNVAHAAQRCPRGDRGGAVEQLKAAIALAARAAASRVAFLDSLVGAASPRERARSIFGKAALGFGTIEIGLAGIDAACLLHVGASLLADDGLAFACELVESARAAVAAESTVHRLPIELTITDDRTVLARFGRTDAARFPRGRDSGTLPHDGVRYVYSGTLPALPLDVAEAGAPERIAAIEARLRTDLLRSGIAQPFVAVEDRVAFLKALDPLLREDRLPCV